MSICISDDPLIQRNIRQNFLCPECEADGYKLRMLESNRIPGLLQLKVIEEDGQKHLLYDISSRESLRTVLMTRVLSKEQIEKFIFCLNRILISLDGYLLDAGDIVMKPEYIYLSEDFEPALCCVPDYCGDFAAAVSDVLRDMLGSVDQRDHTAVVLAYRLFQKTLEPHYVMRDLVKILESGEPHDEREDGSAKRKTPGPDSERERSGFSDNQYDNDSHRENTVAQQAPTDPETGDELFELMSSGKSKKSRKKKKRFFLL